MNENEKMERANKLTVAVTTDGKFSGTFHRTHKELKSVTESESGFKRTGNTATLERELFRKYLQENAANYGINWDPEVKGSVQPKLMSEEIAMVYGADLAKLALDAAIEKVNGEMINTTPYRIGIAKYESNGYMEDPDRATNRYPSGLIAYGKVRTTFTIGQKMPNGEVTALYNVVVDTDIRSTQMKKPESMTYDGIAKNITPTNILMITNEYISLVAQKPDEKKGPEPKQEAAAASNPKIKVKSAKEPVDMKKSSKKSTDKKPQ